MSKGTTKNSKSNCPDELIVAQFSCELGVSDNPVAQRAQRRSVKAFRGSDNMKTDDSPF